MSVKLKSLLLFLLVVVIAFAAWYLGDILTLDFLKDSYQILKSHKDSDFMLFALSYFVIYVFSVALSVPGAVILTVAAGALFGLVKGTVLVSFASSIGALLAFFTSRYLLRSFVENCFSVQYQQIKSNFSANESGYLFSMRLAPIFPFFLINLIMGLMPISWKRFYVVSQLGMLPGTIIYVNAGSSLSELESVDQILSPPVLLSMVLVAVFPYLIKKLTEIKAPDWCSFFLK